MIFEFNYFGAGKTSGDSTERDAREVLKNSVKLFRDPAVGSGMKAPTKIALLCGMVLTSLTCSMVAQTPPAGNSTPCPKAAREGKPRGHKLLQALNLSDKQKAKVAPILEKTKSDVQAIRANSSLSKHQKHEQIETVRQSAEQQLQAVLTPEQFQKFQQMKAERKARQDKEEKASGPVT